MASVSLNFICMHGCSYIIINSIAVNVVHVRILFLKIIIVRIGLIPMIRIKTNSSG